MLLLVACASQSDPAANEEAAPDAQSEGEQLVIYSGRNEELVGPLLDKFKEETGINVKVNYGSTSEMAATILEEGKNSPADIYYGQDAGALGALSREGRFDELPSDLLEMVEPRFRSPDNKWIGTSGRARVVAYNTEALSEDELPDSIMGYTDPKWKGKIGWAPTNGSFQAFVTAMRMSEGEEATREWLAGIQANEPKVYPKNTPTLQAVADGEVVVGFVNHYYLFRKLTEEGGETFSAHNYYFDNGDIGGLMNVSGVGIINTAQNKKAAETFVRFLIAQEAQEYFRDQTYEYPLATGIAPFEGLPALSELNTPKIDLNQLYDLEGTLQLLQELGIL
jgi:iron(III) transport system substrate-binding protein